MARFRELSFAVLAVGLVLALGGCQSPMYAGSPDDGASLAPIYAPGTYEPPYDQRSNVGRGAEEKPSQSDVSAPAEAYEYRGGRDPVTGRAKTQM
jgi:hypothetical protein